MLALVHACTFVHLSRTIRARYAGPTRAFFLVLSLTQFHIPYYAGRTLPNFMALPFGRSPSFLLGRGVPFPDTRQTVLLAYSWLLRSVRNVAPESIHTKRIRNAIILLTAVSTVIRLEIALLLLPLCLALILTGKSTVWAVVKAGMTGGFGSLGILLFDPVRAALLIVIVTAISSPIDYCFWSPVIPHPSLPTFTSTLQILWPELSAFLYNFFEGQAANWGVSPWWYYMGNDLPKVLMGSLPLFLAGLGIVSLSMMGVGGKWSNVVRGRMQEVISLFGLGVVGMIGGLSCVGHKEWRFVVYVVPIINLLAAIMAAALWEMPYRRLRILARLGLIGLVFANLLVTAFSTYLSTNNYPGGEISGVMERLEEGRNRSISIHHHSYPLQTGASLFTFVHSSPSPTTSHSWSAIPSPAEPEWFYIKDEDPALLSSTGAWNAGFDYVVTDVDGWEKDETGWMIAAEIEGLQGVRRGGKWGLEVAWGRKLVVYGRDHRQWKLIHRRSSSL
ncbi:hypothetical protein P7C73_g3445, partial [Tremellales sp. Uapishka_1]